MVSRTLDIAVLLLVALAVLIPRPDVKATAALQLEPERRERVAELEAVLLAKPGDVATSLELADLYLDAHRPEWALATVGGALETDSHDHRLYARRSLALADHFL